MVLVTGEEGLLLIFANVLLQQLGVPIPSEPTLIVAGSWAARGLLPLPRLVGATWLAVLVADSIWCWMGRRYGDKALRAVCRLALSPDSCVRTTEQIFSRWGLKSLTVAKFIPGFPMVAPALAGAMGTKWSRFLVFDLVAAALWSSMPIGAGLIFYRQVDQIIGTGAGIGERDRYLERVRHARHSQVAISQPERLSRELAHGPRAPGEARLPQGLGSRFGPFYPCQRHP